MSSEKPLIGVTGPNKGGTAAWWFTKFAILIQGGRAIRIQPKKGIPDIPIDGLILGGGADINPEHYGAESMESFFSKDKTSGIRQWLIKIGSILFLPFIFFIRKIFSVRSPGIDEERDDMELLLLEKAVEKRIPVLGICRGAQLINIYFGGTLHRDIANFYTEIPRVHSIWPKKKVSVDENSHLFEILGFPGVWVNALHHQAVDRLGNEIKVAASEESGVIQAIEHQQSGNFILGVQWHPEYMPQVPPQRKLFQALVEQAREAG